MNFEGKTAWITGASSGIGRALAASFSGEGARVILSGRRQRALAEAARGCPGDTLVLPFEATDYEALPGLVDKARAWHGEIEILVNNAGISQRSLALDTDFQVYRQLMEVDFFAPLRLTQLVLPHMVARGSGHIVNISSIAGKLGAPLRTGYCAAKHALMGYSDALRAETAQHGLEVTTVTPGFVRTEIAANALKGDGERYGPNDDPVNRGITAAEAARQIVAGMKKGEREIGVGSRQERRNLLVNRLFPEAVFDKMAARAPRRSLKE